VPSMERRLDQPNRVDQLPTDVTKCLRTTLGCVLTSHLSSGSVKYLYDYKIRSNYVQWCKVCALRFEYMLLCKCLYECLFLQVLFSW
jgi:hypothetical protein